MSKQKHFYSHLVDTTQIILDIADMDMSKEERLHLMALIESNLHHVVIDVVLSNLSEDDKKEFLLHLSLDNHDEIWKLLKEKIENIEEKIEAEVNNLKIELKKDIEETKKIKS